MGSAERTRRHDSAKKALRICAWHGCRKRVKVGRRCDEHAAEHAEAQRARRKLARAAA